MQNRKVGTGSHRYAWPGRGLAPRYIYCGKLDPNRPYATYHKAQRYRRLQAGAVKL